MAELPFTQKPLADGWKVAVRHNDGTWLTAVTKPGCNCYEWTKRLLDVELFNSEGQALEAVTSTDARETDIAMIRISPTYRQAKTLRAA